MTGTRSEGEQRRRARNDRSRATFGPFDPLTTISELQAEGIRRASDIAGRLIDMLDSGGSRTHATDPGRNGDGRVNVGDLRGAMARLIDLYGDVLQRTFDSYADLLEQRARMGAHLDGGPDGPVRIEIDSTAGNLVGAGELWLSNGTETTTGSMRLIPSTLVGVDGCIAPAAIVLAPAVVDSLAAGATVRVTVSIEIDPGALPGYYHGYVLVPELPGEALPLTLSVGKPNQEGGAP